MTKALDMADRAFQQDEVPIGAIVVYKNKIVGKGHNQVETLTDVTSHAEMIAITAASNYLGSKYLVDCTLYVTIEPCKMCAGAIELARPKKLIYGAAESKTGFFSNGGELSKNIEVQEGVLFSECLTLMKEFFAAKR